MSRPVIPEFYQVIFVDLSMYVLRGMIFDTQLHHEISKLIIAISHNIPTIIFQHQRYCAIKFTSSPCPHHECYQHSYLAILVIIASSPFICRLFIRQISVKCVQSASNKYCRYNISAAVFLMFLLVVHVLLAV